VVETIFKKTSHIDLFEKFKPIYWLSFTFFANSFSLEIYLFYIVDHRESFIE